MPQDWYAGCLMPIVFCTGLQNLRWACTCAVLSAVSYGDVCVVGVEPDQLQAQEQFGGPHRLHQHSHCLP